MRSIRLGNVAIDGEVEGRGWKMALELKSPKDDVTRGIGQLAEALAYGYNQVALVTTMRAARDIDSKVFDKLGFVLLGVDSKGNVRQVYPTYSSKLAEERLTQDDASKLIIDKAAESAH
jgi:hypothetical protein